MAQNYLSLNRPSPFQSFLQGFQGGQQIMNNISKSNLMAQEADNTRLITAMKLHDEMKGMAYDNLDFYNQTYKPAMQKLGMPGGFLPDYQDVNALNKGLYQTDIMKAQLKARMEGAKIIPERGAAIVPGNEPGTYNFMYPEISPARRAMLESDRQKEAAKLEVLAQKFGYDKALEMMKHGNALTRINANAEKAPKTFRPDLVDTEEGLGYANPTTGVVTPLKGTKGKSKAGGDVEIRKAAAQLAIDAQLVPGTLEFEKAFNANMKLLGGKGNRATAPISVVGGHKASDHTDRTLVNPVTKQRMKSDGVNWIPVE